MRLPIKPSAKKKLNISTAAEVHLINTSSTCLLKKFGKVRTISKLESRKQSVWTSQCILIFHDISSVEHSYLKPNKKSPIVPSTPNASHPTLHIWRSLDNTFIWIKCGVLCLCFFPLAIISRLSLARHLSAKNRTQQLSKDTYRRVLLRFVFFGGFPKVNPQKIISKEKCVFLFFIVIYIYSSPSHGRSTRIR